MITDPDDIPTKSYLSEAIVAPDGSLILTTPPAVPLVPGEKVWVSLAIPVAPPQNGGFHSFEGSVLVYEDPFGPAVPEADGRYSREF